MEIHSNQLRYNSGSATLVHSCFFHPMSILIITTISFLYMGIHITSNHNTHTIIQRSHTTVFKYSNFKMFSFFRNPSQFMYTLPTNHSNLLSIFPIFLNHASSILPITSSHLIPSLMMIGAPPDIPFVHYI